MDYVERMRILSESILLYRKVSFLLHSFKKINRLEILSVRSVVIVKKSEIK